VGDFQAERAVVQNTTRERLQFNVRPLHAVVLDVQLRNVTYPVDWSNAVSLKEQASYDITLATQEREQAISRVGDFFDIHFPCQLFCYKLRQTLLVALHIFFPKPAALLQSAVDAFCR
jgi:hypothetical protein